MEKATFKKLKEGFKTKDFTFYTDEDYSYFEKHYLLDEIGTTEYAVRIAICGINHKDSDIAEVGWVEASPDNEWVSKGNIKYCLRLIEDMEELLKFFGAVFSDTYEFS